MALAHDYGEFRDVFELETIGVPEVLLDKIKLLAKTFPDDVPETDPRYCDYTWNLLANPVCSKVKYADLLVNNGYEDSPAGDGRRFTGMYPNVMNLLAVWEWCQDQYIHINKKGIVEGPEENTFIVRGGSFKTYPKFCRSACIQRMFDYSGNNDTFCRLVYADYGFRIFLKKMMSFL